MVFLSGSKYDYDFIITQLAREFEGQFECLGENSDKNTFQYQLKKNLIMVKQLHAN